VTHAVTKVGAALGPPAAARRREVEADSVARTTAQTVSELVADAVVHAVGGVEEDTNLAAIADPTAQTIAQAVGGLVAEAVDRVAARSSTAGNETLGGDPTAGPGAATELVAEALTNVAAKAEGEEGAQQAVDPTMQAMTGAVANLVADTVARVEQVEGVQDRARTQLRAIVEPSVQAVAEAVAALVTDTVAKVKQGSEAGGKDDGSVKAGQTVVGEATAMDPAPENYAVEKSAGLEGAVNTAFGLHAATLAASAAVRAVEGLSGFEDPLEFETAQKWLLEAARDLVDAADRSAFSPIEPTVTLGSVGSALELAANADASSSVEEPGQEADPALTLEQSVDDAPGPPPQPKVWHAPNWQQIAAAEGARAGGKGLRMPFQVTMVLEARTPLPEERSDSPRTWVLVIEGHPLKPRPPPQPTDGDPGQVGGTAAPPHGKLDRAVRMLEKIYGGSSLLASARPLFRIEVPVTAGEVPVVQRFKENRVDRVLVDRAREEKPRDVSSTPQLGMHAGDTTALMLADVVQEFFTWTWPGGVAPLVVGGGGLSPSKSSRSGKRKKKKRKGPTEEELRARGRRQALASFEQAVNEVLTSTGAESTVSLPRALVDDILSWVVIPVGVRMLDEYGEILCGLNPPRSAVASMSPSLRLLAASPSLRSLGGQIRYTLCLPDGRRLFNLSLGDHSPVVIALRCRRILIEVGRKSRRAEAKGLLDEEETRLVAALQRVLRLVASRVKALGERGGEEGAATAVTTVVSSLRERQRLQRPLEVLRARLLNALRRHRLLELEDEVSAVWASYAAMNPSDPRLVSRSREVRATRSHDARPDAPTQALLGASRAALRDELDFSTWPACRYVPEDGPAPELDAASSSSEQKHPLVAEKPSTLTYPARTKRLRRPKIDMRGVHVTLGARFEDDKAEGASPGLQSPRTQHHAPPPVQATGGGVSAGTRIAMEERRRLALLGLEFSAASQLQYRAILDDSIKHKDARMAQARREAARADALPFGIRGERFPENEYNADPDDALIERFCSPTRAPSGGPGRRRKHPPRRQQQQPQDSNWEHVAGW